MAACRDVRASKLRVLSFGSFRSSVNVSRIDDTTDVREAQADAELRNNYTMNENRDDFIEDDPLAAPTRPRGDAWEQTKQKAGLVRERTEFFLRENPVPLIVGALATGLIIGLAIRYASSSAEKEKAKSPLDRLSWGFLSLPFLWPLLKSIKETYEDSADAIKESVGHVKKIDIDQYAKPIRKRWKAWTH
jgi:hypothetical protein